MDGAIIENAKQVLHVLDVPAKLVKLTNSLYFQSSTSIPLKPNQEPARVHLCCVLAVEQLGEKLGLPLPDTKSPPIPPAQYTKLLQQFRQVLAPHTQAPVTPVKPRQRAARARAVSDLKFELDDTGETYDSDFSDSNEFELDDEIDLSPRKRPPMPLPSTPRKSPRKSIHSSPTKATPSKQSPQKRIPGPTATKIDAIGVRMGLERKTIDTVILAFEKYLELVKDGWGLVYGLFVVISDRAEPKQGIENERRLMRAMSELEPRVVVDRDEWITWTQQIVTGQSWIMEISQHEPQPRLLGSAGGWFQPDLQAAS